MEYAISPLIAFKYIGKVEDKVQDGLLNLPVGYYLKIIKTLVQIGIQILRPVLNRPTLADNPEDLCSKIEKEAKKNHLSINQLILYTLTKTIAYDEALEIINIRQSNVPDLAVEEILSKIPDRKPLKGDEI